MAATKYQVLYRYINEGTNTPITNSMDNEYEEVCEFYTDPNHRIFSTNVISQSQAVDEQQQMIAFGNSYENPKTNMLFAYNGTKKIKHKKWVETATGYVVRDWASIRDKIGNQGDFSKEFTTLNAETPENGGTVVCNEEVFKTYFPKTINIATDETLGDLSNEYGQYYSEKYLYNLITQSVIWKLNTTGTFDHGLPPNTRQLRTGTTSKGDPTYTSYSVGPIGIEKGKEVIRSTYGQIIAFGTSANTYSKITVTPEQVETTLIPGHYEEVTDAPYLIKDTYKRIQLSPWFVNSTYGSLEAALEKAKILVDMVGISNVKLVKIVPFDQFVKIK